MFEKIHRLPSPQSGPATPDGNRKTDTAQHGTDVGWHIIRPFESMPVPASLFWHEALEELGQIPADVRVRILLDGQSSGGVLNEDRK